MIRFAGRDGLPALGTRQYAQGVQADEQATTCDQVCSTPFVHAGVCVAIVGTMHCALMVKMQLTSATHIRTHTHTVL